MADQEIYFHVGLGKVASTFLQRRVFPRLRGVHYISSHRYRKSKTIIAARPAIPKILISREFDRQFEKELRWFTETHPKARIIVLFRRQDDWLASQYRRYVKNGGLASFEEFFDIASDQGLWKIRDACYRDKLELISACCANEPLVITYDELKQSPRQVVRKICRFLRISEISLPDTDPVHTSYSDRQLKVLQFFCRKYIRRKPRGYDHQILHWLFYRPVWAFYHLILYFAYLIPKSWIGSASLIEPQALENIRKFYAEDWEYVVCRSIE